MPRTIKMEVLRFHPEQQGEPVYESFDVPAEENWMVLDGLNYIKDHLDGSLAYRWSCRMGICGSCGMMVNGVPTLTCETRLAELPPGPVRVGPLAHFPVIKDLVIEMDEFMTKLQRVSPWIIRTDDVKPEREFIQTPDQLEKFKQYSLCINCMLCYAACPVYGLNPEFTGPAALALAERYNLDSRDQGAEVRTSLFGPHDGIWDCTVVGECSVACPKHVDPSLAIQQLKFTATKDWLRTYILPWGNK